MSTQQMLRIAHAVIKICHNAVSGARDASKAASTLACRVTSLAVGGALAIAACLPLAACQQAVARSPVVVVLLASATRNEPAPELASPDLDLLRADAGDSNDAIAYVVNPNTGQADEVSLTPRRPDGEVDYGPTRDQTIAQNIGRVQQLLRQQAAQVPFDLLTFIAEAVRVSPTAGTLIVMSSGLSTAGAFDLRQVGWGADPRLIAQQLKQMGALPVLAGWRVVFSGQTVTSAPQPPLPLPQQAELRSYWLAICRAAAAASCQADLLTRPEPPSRSSTPVPLVPVPRVESVHGPSGWSGSEVPADAFFAFNEATLLPGANGILEPLARKAETWHLRISIAGYSSPDGGSAAYNLALSQRRADAVAARLVALGVEPSQLAAVRGYGLAGKTPVACLVGGRLVETVCAEYRYVNILLSPLPANAFTS
jgi:outer membrane protein OmpA-like peptidoglycan-associated protein